MRDGTPDAGFLWRIGVSTLVYLNRAIAGLPVPNAVRRAIHSAGTRCIPAAMLTQASWRAPVSTAAAPGLATTVVPPRTPAMRAPVVSPPAHDDREERDEPPNPFGVHPGDVDDASARFRLDECAGFDRGSDSSGWSDEDDFRDSPNDSPEDVVAEYLEVDAALNTGDENDPPSPRRREERDETTSRRPLARVDNGAVAAGRVAAPELGSAPVQACIQADRGASKDGTPLPPTCRDISDRFLRDVNGRHLCVVLDLDETLVCAYNHEVNGGVPPELSTPEAVAKTTRFTLHKDPRGHTGSHTGTLGLHADAMTAPGEPVPLVASTTTRGGDWARAIGAGALADRIDQTATDLGEPVCTVIERPGVREFLAQLATFAEVCVFTAGMEGYARPLLDAIDPAGDSIHHRLYRQACVKTPIRDHVKDISRLGRDLSATVIVDNNPFSFLLQPHNGIPIVSFTGDPGDDGLLRQLLPVLRRLGDAVARGEDVRPFCRRQFKIEPFFRRYFSQQGIEFDPPRERWEEELEREGSTPMKSGASRKKRGGLLTSR